MEEQNEIMISENEEIITQEPTEEGSSGNGKYIAAGVAIGAAGVIAGRWLCKKVFRPLKRKLRDRLDRELTLEDEENVVDADAEAVVVESETTDKK